MRLLRQHHSLLLSCLNSSKYSFSEMLHKCASLSAQRAVMATAIIREIVNSQPPISFKELSLRDKILNLNPLINNEELSPEVKSEVLSLFTTGIQLNTSIFHQYQLRLGEQTQGQDESTYRNFIFCPHYLTTAKIFQILVKRHSSLSKMNLLLTGVHGIGKTVSFALFISIANFIHKFYHQARQNQQSQLQFQALKRQNLIDIVPKCLYWAIDQQQHSEDSFKIANLIFKQTDDLPKSKKSILQQQLKNQAGFQESFSQLYPQNIQKILIVDQINALANIAKTCSIKQQSPIYNNLSQSTKFLILMNHFKEYRKFGDQLIYSSSTNIKTNIIQQLTKGLYGLGIYGFQVPKKEISVRYQRELKTQEWANIDFWQYFWFQIQRSLAERKLMVSIGQLKQIFFDQCLKNKVEAKSYFRLADVRLFLNDESSDFCQIKEGLPKDRMVKIICKLREQFSRFCYLPLKSKLTKFIERTYRQYRIAVLAQLYEFAVIELNKKANDLKIPAKNVKGLLNIIAEDPSSLGVISEEQDRAVLVYENAYDRDGNQTIKFILSTIEVVQILASSLYPKIVGHSIFEGNFSKNISKHSSIQGINLKMYLLQSLKDQVLVSIYREFYKFNENNYEREEQAIQLSFKIQNYVKFQSFSANSEASKISQNCKRIFLETKKNADYDFVGIPFKNDEADNCSSNIDFIVVKYNKRLSFYQFYSFEVTVQTDPKTIEEKRKSAIALFTDLLQRQTDFPIVISHTILCSPLGVPTKISKEAEEAIQDKRRLSVHYGDWSRIQFKKWRRQSNNVAIFQIIVKAIKNIEHRQFC